MADTPASLNSATICRLSEPATKCLPGHAAIIRECIGPGKHAPLWSAQLVSIQRHEEEATASLTTLVRPSASGRLRAFSSTRAGTPDRPLST